MATMKELKQQAAEALELYHSLQRRIEKLREKRKLTCKHEKTKIVPRDYFEVGRMRAPIEWKEEVCCKCKSVLAESSSSAVEKWTVTDLGKHAVHLKSVPDRKLNATSKAT